MPIIILGDIARLPLIPLFYRIICGKEKTMTNIGTSFGYNSLIRQAINSKSDRTQEDSKWDFAAVMDINDPKSQYDTEQYETESDGNGLPKRWTSNKLYTIDTDALTGYTVNEEALSKVKEQLRAEGIDPDSRTPTHEITDEQTEWLASRYDFDFLSVCSISHTEYGNFMLDLAYLNVFSFDEVRDMFGVLPFNANHKAYMYKHGSDGGYLNEDGSVDDDKDLLADLLMEYIKIKYSGHTEKEYERMTKEFTAKIQERTSVITEFFDRVSNHTYGTRMNIVDMSGKIVEEFGGLM